MSRGNWNRIKQSKLFYVQSYRKVMTLILVSQVINVILCLLITYFHLHQPARTFYATSGVTSPIQLSPIDTPNYSAEALLPPDPINDDGPKVIPE
jgi:intracellular multiplication protein IcmM